MTELDLYKFIRDNEVEVDWRGEEELIAWIHPSDIKDLVELIDRCDADDGGIECTLQNGGYIVLNLFDICVEEDINPENILPKEELF